LPDGGHKGRPYNGYFLRLPALAYRTAQAYVHLACMFFDAIHDVFG
jgi:hypothetical protein